MATLPVIQQEFDVAPRALLSESVFCDQLRSVAINPDGPPWLPYTTLN